MALLLFAVVVPAICLLWFMGVAMRNEQRASQRSVEEIYRGQLTSIRGRVEKHWSGVAAELERMAETNSAAVAFERAVKSGLVDSLVIFDGKGNVAYPNKAEPRARIENEGNGKWSEASQLEFSHHDYVKAAGQYALLAKETTDANLAAQALQAQVRCLVQAGQTASAISIINTDLNHERYQRAADTQGRLIVANAELLALELIGDRTAPESHEMSERLKRRLMDYENPVIAAPQRRFLMKELRRVSPEIEFPMLEAEELAEGIARSRTMALGNTGVRAADSGNGILLSAKPHRVLALVKSAHAQSQLSRMLLEEPISISSRITVTPPSVENDSSFIWVPVGEPLNGWRLSLWLNDPRLFEDAAAHQRNLYLGTGVLMVATIGVLGFLAIRVLRRQTALARLKNDLAATVSHELKTPLSSIRVLVDTLLDSERLDEPKAREYLQLIARENERLSRLIQNFLTFSRMERKKYVFHFEAVPAGKIIDDAVVAMRERFSTAGCAVDIQIEGVLPMVEADADALTTAVINLLDNGCKFSEETRRVTLRACEESEFLVISVEDRGIGIAAVDIRGLFQPFKQLDERLSRRGSGCGLGLSIVQFIIDAHRGMVSVKSELGRGSTFTLRIPVAMAESKTQKQAYE